MKILVIALSGAGDVLMSTPLIKELRLNYPNARIDCLVMQGEITRDLLSNNDDINNVIYFNFLKEGYLKSLLFTSKLRKERYDISINIYPQAVYKYGLVSYLIHAKNRLGFKYDTDKLGISSIFFNSKIGENFANHAVINNLRILKSLNLREKSKKIKLILNLSNENISFAERYIKLNKLKKFVVLHAGSGKLKNFHLKRWPERNFAELSKGLNKRGYKIVLAGGSDESEIKSKIITLSGLKRGKDILELNTNILNVAAIIEKSNAVVSNDSVIGHIAAAMNTKVIALFGPTAPENTAPYSKKLIVLCKRPKSTRPFKHGDAGINPKAAEYMNKITVSEVLSKIK